MQIVKTAAKEIKMVWGTIIMKRDKGNLILVGGATSETVFRKGPFEEGKLQLRP